MVRERGGDGYDFELCPLPLVIPISTVLSVDPASLHISLGTCFMSAAST